MEKPFSIGRSSVLSVVVQWDIVMIDWDLGMGVGLVVLACTVAADLRMVEVAPPVRVVRHLG